MDTSVDDVQCNIDKMMLTIFEVMRGCAENTIEDKDNVDVANKIINAYKETVASVDNLIGIDKSLDQQKMELSGYSQQYRAVREDVICLENKLVQMHENINQQLSELVCQESLDDILLKNHNSS